MTHRLANWQRITGPNHDLWVFAGDPDRFDIYPAPIPISHTNNHTGLPGITMRTADNIYRIWHSRVFTARNDAYCPYCNMYIREGRSQIVHLPEPTTPIAYQWHRQGCHSAITGRQFNHLGHTIAMHGRNYAHYDCIKYMMRTFWHPECTYCGTTTNLTIDHIHPTSELGPDEPGNITVACRRCNSRKGTMHVNDFLAKLNA